MKIRAIGAVAALILVASVASGEHAVQRGRTGDRGPRGQGGRAPTARRASPADAGERRTLVVGGQRRSYYFYRSTRTIARPLPLVIVYHGGQGDAGTIAAQTGFNDVADRNGFAVAYPESIDHWNDGRDATAAFGDDTRFTSELIDELVQTGGVDRSRVYATGASNGGVMTLRLACERAKELAAFAAVAASFPDTYMSRCSPARPVPMLIVHGSEDRLIPARGATIPAGPRRLGGTVTPLPDTLEFWRRANGCRAQTTSATLPDTADDGTTVKVTEYHACAANAALTFVNVVGGGHTWPGARVDPVDAAGRVSHDIDGSQYIWDFFSVYTLSEKR